jgi:hypothetical protein
MNQFLKFPRTPHLVWLAKNRARGDKVLAAHEADEFLQKDIVVEEKVDGTNIGFSFDQAGAIRAQSRGDYLRKEGHPQFRLLWSWLAERKDLLGQVLKYERVLFGEWCFAVHSVRYNRLPDWFLGFDIYDHQHGRFCSTDRRNRLLDDFGIKRVPEIARGRFSKEELIGLLGRSRLGNGLMEGLYLRQDAGDWLVARAKIARPEFVEEIGVHWSSRRMESNAVINA